MAVMTLEIGHDRVYLGNGGSAIRVIDTESMEERVPVLKDIYKHRQNHGSVWTISISACGPALQQTYRILMPTSTFYYAFLKSVGKHMMGGINHVHSPEEITRVTDNILETILLSHRPHSR